MPPTLSDSFGAVNVSVAIGCLILAMVYYDKEIRAKSGFFHVLTRMVKTKRQTRLRWLRDVPAPYLVAGTILATVAFMHAYGSTLATRVSTAPNEKLVRSPIPSAEHCIDVVPLSRDMGRRMKSQLLGKVSESLPVTGDAESRPSSLHPRSIAEKLSRMMTPKSKKGKKLALATTKPVSEENPQTPTAESGSGKTSPNTRKG